MIFRFLLLFAAFLMFFLYLDHHLSEAQDPPIVEAMKNTQPIYPIKLPGE